ncbi:MAG: TolC family protein, partial [Pseudomonadota bacterium]|nr:TolC family protein [Pseudomonadota bacterium]
ETQAAYQRGRYGYLDYVSARQELLSARRTQIEAAACVMARVAAQLDRRVRD